MVECLKCRELGAIKLQPVAVGEACQLARLAHVCICVGPPILLVTSNVSCMHPSTVVGGVRSPLLDFCMLQALTHMSFDSDLGVALST